MKEGAGGKLDPGSLLNLQVAASRPPLEGVVARLGTGSARRTRSVRADASRRRPHRMQASRQVLVPRRARVRSGPIRLAGRRWWGLAGAGLLAAVVLVSAPWHLRNWILTHWAFRYGDGLRGRALVGSLVGWWAEEPVSRRTILLASGTLVAMRPSGPRLATPEGPCFSQSPILRTLRAERQWQAAREQSKEGRHRYDGTEGPLPLAEVHGEAPGLRRLQARVESPSRGS